MWIPSAPHISGPLPPTRFWEGLWEPSGSIFSSKKSHAKKNAKSRAELLPRRLQEPKVAPGGSQNTSKIDPGKGPERVPNPLSYKNVELSPNLIIYCTKAISRTSENHFFRRCSGPKRCEKRPSNKIRKSDTKQVSRKRPRSSRRAPRAPPRLPK